MPPPRIVVARLAPLPVFCPDPFIQTAKSYLLLRDCGVLFMKMARLVAFCLLGLALAGCHSPAISHKSSTAPCIISTPIPVSSSPGSTSTDNASKLTIAITLSPNSESCMLDSSRIVLLNPYDLMFPRILVILFIGKPVSLRRRSRFMWTFSGNSVGGP